MVEMLSEVIGSEDLGCYSLNSDFRTWEICQYEKSQRLPSPVGSY